jgi:hypothetical protein
MRLIVFVFVCVWVMMVMMVMVMMDLNHSYSLLFTTIHSLMFTLISTTTISQILIFGQESTGDFQSPKLICIDLH